MVRLAALIAFVLAATTAGAAEKAVSSCVACHGDLLAEAGGDVHREAGFDCADCHHGDPKAEDEERAMSAARGFVGKPKAMAAALMCGSCHSDIERMRVINPRLATDQLAQYRTSRHGKLAAQGDEKVATCVSCHGFHGIRHVKDPASTASPGKIVETCTGCHQAKYMAGRKLPTDQLAKYKSSVHGKKRLLEQDLGAPACNDCHGNHGAAPPGVFAVTHVCGRCHATQAELFEASSHAAHFRDGGVPPCTTCHEHHDIMPTSDAMLGAGDGAVCGACHQSGDRCDLATGRMKASLVGLTTQRDRAREDLKTAENLGMDVERPTYDLAGADDALVRARAQVHAFSEERFEAVIGEGMTAAAGVRKAAAARLAEHGFRRKGLAVASGFLLLFAALLAVKAYRIERDRA